MIAHEKDVSLPAVAGQGTSKLFLTLLVVLGGAIAALVVLPGPLAGSIPAVSWYLVRSTGFVALGLLWLSMVFGLLITTKVGSAWPGGPIAYDMHQYCSVLGLAFGFIHPLLMLGSQYSLVQIFVPFGGIQDRTVPIAFGQIALVIMAIIVPSYAARWIIGPRAWRILHYLSFATFVLALGHGLLSGTDTAAPLATGFYWFITLSLLVLAVYRVHVARTTNRRTALVYNALQKVRLTSR